MPSFSVTPLSDVPAPQAQAFPDFIQFQAAGTNLGLPDADTLNFSTGLTATRGTGENANVVTVTSEGGGGGATLSLLQLNNPPDPPVEEIFLFDGNPFLLFWNSAVDIASADWTWDDTPGDGHMVFNTSGMYRLTMTCYVEAETEWPDGNTTYGSTIDGPSTSTAAQARTHTTGDVEDTRTRMQWTDQHIITVTDPDVGFSYYLGLFAKATDTTHIVQFAQMRVAIERIAAAG